MNDTTYTDNGLTYEATVSESWVVDLIRKFSWKSKMILKELAKAAESTSKQARQESPLGLTDKSIIKRWNKERFLL